MSAPPLKRPVLTCLKKHRHPDEFTARAVAMRCIELNRNVDVLYVYRCPECRGWHLTKWDNGIGAKVTADNPIHAKAEA